MRKYISLSLLACIMLIMTACSKGEYTDCIPANSTALISISSEEITKNDSPIQSILTPIIGKGEQMMKGIDLSKDIYLFETVDGMLGVSVSLSDNDALQDYLHSQSTMTDLEETEGINFFATKSNWLLGFDSSRLLVMGPVVNSATEQKKMKMRIVSMMKQEKEESIITSGVWDNLSKMQGSVKLVAQASALPEQLIAPCTIGAPKGTDPTDIIVKGEISFKDSIAYIAGETMSFNPNIDQSLNKTKQLYRPFTNDWKTLMSDEDIIGVFMNVDGAEYMPHLMANKALRTMILGTDAFDKIKGNNGDLAILIKSQQGNLEQSTSRVINLKEGQSADKQKLIVALNPKAMAGTTVESLMPCFETINKIVFTLR